MKKLYILPFDHRGSFIKMFGFIEAQLSAEGTARLADYKHVVYEGFLLSLEKGVPRDAAAILVDEQFGTKIHEEARQAGITRILTTERSGQDEFDFEYGDEFGKHIDALAPDYVKVLVRYNSAGDASLNARQRARLKVMNDFCKAHRYKFLFELLAPPTPTQLAVCGGDQVFYDRTVRWEVMRDSIKELQENGIEPDVWKLEGLEEMEQMRAVTDQARSGGRDTVGVIVLGRGESDEKVRVWLGAAAGITGVVGFAVGRTVFKQALLDLRAGKIKREEAANRIAGNFKGYADLFERAARGK